MNYDLQNPDGWNYAAFQAAITAQLVAGFNSSGLDRPDAVEIAVEQAAAILDRYAIPHPASV